MHELSKQEVELASILLGMAADKFANHGCNDFELPETWTQEECDAFTLAMSTWNGDPEEHEPGSRITQDWYAMNYLAAMLRKCSEQPAIQDWITDRPPTDEDALIDCGFCVLATYSNGLTGWERVHDLRDWTQPVVLPSDPPFPVIAWQSIPKSHEFKVV